jgi:hypothetical protein
MERRVARMVHACILLNEERRWRRGGAARRHVARQQLVRVEHMARRTACSMERWRWSGAWRAWCMHGIMPCRRWRCVCVWMGGGGGGGQLTQQLVRVERMERRSDESWFWWCWRGGVPAVAVWLVERAASSVDASNSPKIVDANKIFGPKRIN